MGWDNEYQCYTNQDNPFGDSALTNTFVWSKKLAKEGVKSVSHDELEALNRQKQMENKIELEKVTKYIFMSKSPTYWLQLQIEQKTSHEGRKDETVDGNTFTPCTVCIITTGGVLVPLT